MHGFIGYIEDDPGAARAMGDWMRSWIALSAPQRALEWQDGPFTFLTSAEDGWDDEPTACADGLRLVFHGFIARDQLAEEGRPEPTTDAETAAALLRRYRDRGADSLAGLNGRYVICVWNAGARSIELMDDVLGLKPVFLWQDGDSFAFSSHVWPIVCPPRFRRDVDRIGVADLLLVSHQQEERTLFEHVSVLPAGTVTTFRDGRIESRCVAPLEFSQERWDWSIEATAERMHELLARSVDRRLPGGVRVRLPLSGGLDSRALLGMLADRRTPALAVTQYMHGAFGKDGRLARKLAARAHTPLKPVPLPDDFLTRYRARCVAINSGMYDIHTGRFLSLFDQSREEPMATVSGHLGGELTGRFHIPDTAFQTEEEHFERALREENMYRFPRERVLELMAAGAPKAAADESFDVCRRLFFEHPGTHWQRFWHWDLLQYRRRYDSYMLLYFEQFHKVLAPFYDRDFTDFMFSLPWAALEDQRAYCAMHARQWPALARVPNSNTDRPPIISTRYILADFAATQYRRFFRHPLQKVLHLRRWVSHQCEQVGYALVRGSAGVLDQIMAGRDMMAPYLDPQAVAAAVDRHRGGDYSSTFGLLGISAVATALEFVDDPQRALQAWERADG